MGLKHEGMVPIEIPMPNNLNPKSKHQGGLEF